MADVFIIANDAFLAHRLEPFVERLKDDGYEVMTAESETRASHGAGGEFVRDLVLILSSVILTHEYDKIKAWLREWFVELPKPKDPGRRRQLSVRVEDDNRKVVERFFLDEE